MAKVKIQGHASGTGVITLTAPNTSTDRTITLPDATGTLATTADTGVAGITSAADATAMTITSDEKIGIGTASPACVAKGLHIQTSSAGTLPALQADADDVVVEGSTPGITLMGATNGGGMLAFGDTDDADVGQIFYYHADNSMRVKTAGAERLRILSGGGITFNGDTAAANALDDYEEGTWTPVIGGSSESGQVYSSQDGFYTKIGNMVFCHGYVALSTEGTINSFARLKGFPFSVSGSNNSAMTLGYVKQFGLSADHILEGWVYNDNLIYLYESDHQDDDPTQIGAGHVLNTSTFAFSFFFTTTD
jgi:hypothetical protein